MKNSKFSLLLVLTLVLSLFLSACSGSSDKKNNNSGSKTAKAPEQVLNVLESAEIPTMDSVMAQDVMSFTMLNAVNDGLYRLDQNNNVIPAVADGMPVPNADKTVYTIKLKKDTKWSNGDPVTAHDFVFAWQRAIDPKTASPYGPYYMEDKIKNATEIANGKMKPSELGIKAVDDYTLEVTLVKPLPYFESYITFQLFYPEDQKYVESQGKDYAKDAAHVLYNGPFTMTKWDGPQGTEWTLAKNDNYWDAKDVSLKTINFNVSKDPQASANAFEAGQADITPKLAQKAIISQYQGSKSLVQYMEPTVWWLKMNEKNPALKNSDIRHAIALSIDKQALVDNVLANGSKVADYIVAKDFTSLNGKDFREDSNKFLQTDKKKAQEYWKKGLAELGKKDLSISYVGQDTDTAKLTDAFIKDQLEKNLPGIKINIESVPFSVRLDREDKQQYDLLMGGWGPDYQDPMTFMDLWASDSQQQHMSYVNPKVDALIKQAGNELAAKPDERWKALQDAEKIILEDDAAIAPLYQRSVNLLIAPKVKGFVHHPVGADYSLQWIKITNDK
ncbi:MAG: peptide ABC transporter substrate-binding protein [Bacillota bacterium]|nr:peptide ABC transporter substrate-binding protein [Bacillota bacterium]